LRRVGCLTAAVDGEWNAASQRSLAQFNRYAKTKFDVKLASLDALDAIKRDGEKAATETIQAPAIQPTTQPEALRPPATRPASAGTPNLPIKISPTTRP